MENKTLYTVNTDGKKEYEVPALFTMKLSENIMGGSGPGADAGSCLPCTHS